MKMLLNKMIEEEKELEFKIEKYNFFQKTDIFENLPIEERMLFIKQLEHMSDYLKMLQQRIKCYLEREEGLIYV